MRAADPPSLGAGSCLGLAMKPLLLDGGAGGGEELAGSPAGSWQRALGLLGEEMVFKKV